MTAPQSAGQKAFLFDLNRCTGCQACEVACTIENQLDGFSWRQVTSLNEAHHAGVSTIHLSLACNHCEEPPCMEHCPALAYDKDPATGLVSLDAQRCIGCGYCSWACPYDAPKLDDSAGVMTKCTFCAHRQAEGLEPACVEQCPTGALGFGDLAELPGVELAPGMPTLEPGPSIRFVPWRREEPGCSEASGTGNGNVGLGKRRRKISLRSEWPLVAFTLIAAALVAVHTASVAGALVIWPPAFLAATAIAMGLSTLHLGKPLRAWRAMLNVRRSWLSREIVLFSAFLGIAMLCLLAPVPPWLHWGAAALGFAALFAVDRVYDIARPPESRLAHSADVLLTGALLASVLSGAMLIVAAVAAVKLGLYLFRKISRPRRGLDPRWSWSALRAGFGFAAPLPALVTAGPAWALAAIAIGELIDRCELYEEQEVPTPRGQMVVELQQRLASRRGAQPDGAAMEA
ncbi:MAG: 4Fe-4S dicluster domain-containing protein [bacterium]|nr:4Fe-4S dicluster domain-containing protein [bacterium]